MNVLFGEDPDQEYPLFSKKKNLHFYRNRGRFDNIYINKTDKKKYLDDNGTGVKPKYFTNIGMK